MTYEKSTDPRKNFVPRFLPWLLGAVMLVIYGFTLNRWVTLDNINQVAKLSGWTWEPQLFGPLTFLVTYPFHWLPVAQIPLALNLFSAMCSAATLTMLARSVALLPHDRTEAQRLREQNELSFLTGWPAWLPPVVAVLLGGLQLTFWEHATSFTGESFNLLIFAFIIWQLQEYRLDESEWRLLLAAAVYGAGMSENWALTGYFPVFLTAIIWLRKLEFFNLRFLARLTASWLVALVVFLLVLPLAMKFSGKYYSFTVWQALKPVLQLNWHVAKAFMESYVRHNLALISLTTLLPVLLLSIRWSPTFGDSSRIGSSLVSYLFYLVNAVIFTVSVWVMFDPPFSPRQCSMGTPALTFYYFAALSIGYYCGYFLLVFGKEAVPSRQNPEPAPALPPKWEWLGPLIVTGTFLAVALAVGTLIHKNQPLIRALNDDSLAQYARFTAQKLPPHGALLLCDSEGGAQNWPLRGFLLQAELAREGRLTNFPVVDTRSLNWAPYHRYLHTRYPKQWPQIVGDRDMGSVNPLGLLSTLNLLSKSNTLCYLNPSYGYFFEEFYLEPHGLVYELKSLPKDTLLPPALDKKLIAENEAFWSQLTGTVQPAITRQLAEQQALAQPDQNTPNTFSSWLLALLHVQPEPNPNTLLAGMFYSRSLDFWAVQLQGANELEKAADRFTTAVRLNPDNVAAAISLDFNRTLRAGTPTAVDLSRVTTDQFGKYHNWNEVLNANGPFDEISFSFEYGALLTQGGLPRQAIAPFVRVHQLLPGNLPARLWIAQNYLFNRLPDRALEYLNDPFTKPAKYSLNANNSTEVNILTAAARFQKNETDKGIALLETEINRHPDDETLLTVSAQAYMMRGLYTNALHVIERKLAQTPDAPQWLFGKGYANIQLGAYDQAITALTRVLQIQTNDPTARFNRALAYLQSDRLDKARADYRELQSTYTNSFQVAFGLAEVAWRQHNTNESVRNYKIYLANAPTNTAEFKAVRERLGQLHSK